MKYHNSKGIPHPLISHPFLFLAIKRATSIHQPALIGFVAGSKEKKEERGNPPHPTNPIIAAFGNDDDDDAMQ